MALNDKDAERIARELIAEIALAWKPIPGTRCVTEGDSYLFEFTIQPTRVVRYARRVQRPDSPTLVRFNPLAEATEIVIVAAFKIEPSTARTPPDTIDFLIRREAKERIHQLLLTAPEVFQDATWHARIIGETLCALESVRAFGRPDIERGLLESTIRQIEGRIRQRFGSISKARKPKITEFGITIALKIHLAKFEESGEIPSQRKFAKDLGVTAKAWRDFLKKHNLPDHDEAVRIWLEEITKQSGPGAGTLSQGESPKGIN